LRRLRFDAEFESLVVHEGDAEAEAPVFLDSVWGEFDRWPRAY